MSRKYEDIISDDEDPIVVKKPKKSSSSSLKTKFKLVDAPSKKIVLKQEPEEKKVVQHADIRTMIGDLNATLKSFTVEGLCFKKKEPFVNQKYKSKTARVELKDDSGTLILEMSDDYVVSTFLPLFVIGGYYRVTSLKPVTLSKSMYSEANWCTKLEMGKSLVNSIECPINLNIKTRVTPISKLVDLAENASVTIFGRLVRPVSELMQMTSRKTGKPLQKRTITIGDRSGACVDVTLWNEDATKHTPETLTFGQWVRLDEGKVSHFNNTCSVNCSFDSVLVVDPVGIAQFPERSETWSSQHFQETELETFLDDEKFDNMSRAMSENERDEYYTRFLCITADNSAKKMGCHTLAMIHKDIKETSLCGRKEFIILVQVTNASYEENKICKETKCRGTLMEGQEEATYICKKCAKVTKAFDVNTVLSLGIHDKTGEIVDIRAYGAVAEEMVQAKSPVENLFDIDDLQTEQVHEFIHDKSKIHEALAKRACSLWLLTIVAKGSAQYQRITYSVKQAQRPDSSSGQVAEILKLVQFI